MSANYLITMELLLSLFLKSSFKEEFGFNNILNFKWQQLIYAIPPFWKKIIKETDNADNLLLPNHHLIKKTHYLVLRN